MLWQARSFLRFVGIRRVATHQQTSQSSHAKLRQETAHSVTRATTRGVRLSCFLAGALGEENTPRRRRVRAQREAFGPEDLHRRTVGRAFEIRWWCHAAAAPKIKSVVENTQRREAAAYDAAVRACVQTQTATPHKEGAARSGERGVFCITLNSSCGMRVCLSSER